MHVASLALLLAALPAQAPPASRPAPPAFGPRPRPLPLMTLPPSLPSGPTVPEGLLGDEQVLQRAGVPTTGPGLLDFFRKQTPPAPPRDQIARLIEHLNAADSSTRDRAAGELVAVGPAAVPLLRQAANNSDDVVRSTRARQCLQFIEGREGARLAASAARLLAARKPAGATQVLLAYLPFAHDSVVEDVEAALMGVGARDGRPDPALLQALADPVPVRRAVAAQVLCRLGGPAQLAAVRPLLKDPRPTVRLRAALGLAGAHDAEGVPVLIDLLGDLPSAGRQQAEDFLTGLAGDWVVAGPRGDDGMARGLRREVWKTWWRQVDGQRLLAEFRARTPSDAQRDEVLALIRQLDDDSDEVRQKASDELAALGATAAPLLRQALHGSPHPSPLIARCLEVVERDAPPPLPAAAPRLLVLRRPPGTVEALLGYLPFAEDEEAAGQVIDLLASAGCPDGRADPALVQALKDRVPARRAGAAIALCKGGARDQFPAVQQLLKDPDLQVRFRTALALADAHVQEALPVLIALLGELPIDQAWEAEDYLARVAGDQAPDVVLTGAPAVRARSVEAWKKWWRDQGRTLDLARIESRADQTGRLLIVENFNPTTSRGRVLETGREGKVRWEVSNLMGPWSAQLLRGGRLLVVEQNGHVTERDRQGMVLSDHFWGTAFSAERLRNGHTWIACRTQVLELDATGKVVLTCPSSHGTLLAARHFRDGQSAFITYNGAYVRIDASGKQVKTFQVDLSRYSLGGAEVLPGDRVLVAVQNLGKVLELTPEGKVAWEAAVRFPGIPHRLANGQTIVPCDSSTGLVTLDRAGKVVSERKNLPYRPFRICAP